MNDIFVKKVEQLISSADRNGVAYTSFLSEEEQQTALALLNKRKVVFDFESGIEPGQRKILGVFGSDFDRQYAVFPYCILWVSVSLTDRPLTHRDYLGSLLGLGIRRDVIGDISVVSDGAYIAVCDVMCEYLLQNLTRIGHASCRVERLPEGSVVQSKQEFLETVCLVTSNRLDCFVASITNSSRKKSCERILSGTVLINGAAVTDTTKHLSLGDRLTIRGSGKYLIAQNPDECSVTGKGRLKVPIKKYQ